LGASQIDIEDFEQLLPYLKTRGAIGASERNPELSILGGGVSNRVVQVRRANGVVWVLKQGLPKLRVSVDWFSDPARIQHEALALKWLRTLGLDVPELQFEDANQHLIAMDAVAEPHVNWKQLLLAGHLEIGHVEAFARMLAHLHLRSAQRRGEISLVFEDDSYFESLRVEPYYLYTAEQIPEVRPFIDAVVASTRANHLCLVHGDYSPKNVLIHDDRLVLLDHEVAHFGDPAFDLGFSMTHLLSKAHHVSSHRSLFAEATVRYWQLYWELVGGQALAKGLERRAIESTLCCLLARVAGRSPLEYFTVPEKERQRLVVMQLMKDVPKTTPQLVAQFVEGLTAE